MASTIPAPLAGKTAIITGGSRGIGAGIAVELAHKGCTAIAVTYARNKAAAEGVLSSIRSSYPNVTTAAIQADLISPTFGKDIVSKALAELKMEAIDIIVSNAAMAEQTFMHPIETHTHELFTKIMTANVWSPARLALEAMQHMPRGGRIINISSTGSQEPGLDPAIIYCATKSALDSVTRSLAWQYAAEKGITINSVSVGPTNTEGLSSMFDQHPEWYEMAKQKATAEKRLGEVDDIVQIVSFLCSDGARWMNGNNIPANGGALLVRQG